MNEKEREQKIDELLTLLGQEMSRSRAEYMSQEPPLEVKLVEVKPAHERKKKSYWKRIAVVCLCCIVAFTGLATVTTEANLAELFGFVFDNNENESLVDPAGSRSFKYPAYLPEGYELESEAIIGDGIELIYYNNKIDEYINLIQISDEEYYSSFDNETSNMVSCFVNESQAFFSEMDGMNSIIWVENDICYHITAPVDMLTLVEIGESLE